MTAKNPKPRRHTRDNAQRAATPRRTEKPTANVKAAARKPGSSNSEGVQNSLESGCEEQRATVSRCSESQSADIARQFQLLFKHALEPLASKVLGSDAEANSRVLQRLRELREMARPQSLLTVAGDEAKWWMERALMLFALERHNWNLTHTAKALHMASPTAVLQAIKKYDISDEYNKRRGYIRVAIPVD